MVFKKINIQSLIKGLAMLTLAWSVSACNKSSSVSPSGGTGTINVEAVVDGQNWKGSGNSKITNVTGITTFAIGAGALDKSNIAITIFEERTGSFDLEGKALWTNKDQEVYSASAGELQITKLEDNKVSGTFRFRARPMQGSGAEISIQSGVFTDINVSR